MEGKPQERDLLVVLRGGDVPFLLRRVGELDRYLIVCDACEYKRALGNLKLVILADFSRADVHGLM